MLKRTRADAEAIVAEKFPGLPGHVSAMLTTRYESYQECYCANCHKTGTAYRVVGQNVRSKTCMCKSIIDRNDLAERLFKESNIPQLYHDAEIDKWQNPGSDERERQLNTTSFQAIDVYTKCLKRMKEKGYGLFLCGPNGVGKTYLACAVGNRATKAGNTVRFYTMATIVQMIIRGWFHESEQEAVQGMRDADYLIIDDLDKIYRTKTGIETSLFDNMLRERLQHGRPCIITSNRVLGQAADDYTQSIYSMLKEHCAELIFMGKDYREGMSNSIVRDILDGN